MGLTWVVGILVFESTLLPFAYVFTVFVAFQVRVYLLVHSQFISQHLFVQGLAIFIIFILMSKMVSSLGFLYCHKYLACCV